MSEKAEVQFERMRPHQIRQCRQRADVAFLPLAALEWHGVQSPVGTDALKAHGVCCAAAERLGGGAVFPSLVWGLPRDSFYVGTSSSLGDIAKPMASALGTDVERLVGTGSHGGMDVQEQWLFYQRLLRMSLEQIAGFGFRSIYICCGHNPLIHWARPVAITFARATRMAGLPVTVDFGGEYDAAGLRGDHGGKWETSLMMAIDPNTVNLGEIERHSEYQGVGCGSDAVESTRQQGQVWLDTCATAIAKEARWLIDNYPQCPLRHVSTR